MASPRIEDERYMQADKLKVFQLIEVCFGCKSGGKLVARWLLVGSQTFFKVNVLVLFSFFARFLAQKVAGKMQGLFLITFPVI